jgi:DNA-binding transcriptional LysR family regulator
MVNLRSIDLNLLPVFEAVYEERNMTRAADRLAMSQPAVSNAVARLRAALGDPLFVAGRRGSVVTPTADDLYPRIKTALVSVREGLGERRRFDPGSTTRRFAVGTLYSPGVEYWKQVADWAKVEAPHASWKISQQNHRDTGWDALRSGRIDVLLDNVKPRANDLDSMPLLDDELIVAVASHHPRIKSSITRSQFLAERHVAHTSLRSPASLAYLEGVLGAHALDVALEVREPVEIAIAVAGTDFIAACNRRVAEPWKDLLGLRVLPSPFRVPPIRSFVVWHRSRDRDQGHRWLRNGLIRLARASDRSTRK